MKILKIFSRYDKAKSQMEKDAVNMDLSTEKTSKVNLTITLKNGTVIYYKILDGEFNLNKLRCMRIDCFFVDDMKELSEREWFVLNERLKRDS